MKEYYVYGFLISFAIILFLFFLGMMEYISGENVNTIIITFFVLSTLLVITTIIIFFTQNPEEENKQVF